MVFLPRMNCGICKECSLAASGANGAIKIINIRSFGMLRIFIVNYKRNYFANSWDNFGISSFYSLYSFFSQLCVNGSEYCSLQFSDVYTWPNIYLFLQ